MNKLAALGLILTLGGCAALREPDPATVLRAAPRFEPAAALASAPPIAVAPVMAEGAASERRYAYVRREEPGVVRQAATLFWEDPPPKMLERGLVDVLRARVGPAVGPGAPVETGRRVSARLERFEEVTGGGAPAEAHVAFEAALTQDRTLKASGRYCGRAPIAADSPSARARAFEAALGSALARLGDDLRRDALASGC